MGTLSSLSLLLLAVMLAYGKKKFELKRTMCMLTLNSSNTTLNSSNIIDRPQAIYYQLNSTNDTVRYVWSLVGLPSLFMSVTKPDGNKPDNKSDDGGDCVKSAKESFDWRGFFNHTNSSDFPSPAQGSAHIPGYEGEFAFTIVFRNVIEFNDRNSKGKKDFHILQLNDSNTYNIVPLDNLSWTYDHSSGLLKGKSNAINSSFEVDIRIKVPTSSDRLSYFPKTLYTENSTTFDFVFRNFDYNFTDKEQDDAHLVLEMLLVHGPKTKNGSVSEHFSIDDEYTPSVFKTLNYIFGTPGDAYDKKGFLQWKPISYLGKKRLSTKSQQANYISGLPAEYQDLMDRGSLATALYNSASNISITQIFIVFATDDDEEDGASRYVSWTGLLGFGVPPQDKVSSVVWVSIFVGLGVPAALTLLGGVYVIIHKKPWTKIKKLRKSNRNGYEPVDQDG